MDQVRTSCLNCDGLGNIYDHDNLEKLIPCPVCGGTGEIWVDDENSPTPLDDSQIPDVLPTDK